MQSIAYRRAAFALALAAALGAGASHAQVLGPPPEAADQKFGTAVMSAIVAANGSLVWGAGAVSASQVSPGTYDIVFSRDLQGCAVTVSTFTGGTVGNVVSLHTNSTAYRVELRLLGGQFTLVDFNMIVFCAR